MQNRQNSVISFCIPTKNFGSYIVDTIDSIIRQGDPSIEIVVVDGGSTDNTRQLIETKKQEWPAIKYIFLEKPGGVDADLEMAISEAKGEYVWLLSADDHLVEGAIASVRRALDEAPTVILTNRVDCDATLLPLNNRYWLSNPAADLLIDFRDRNQSIRYFRSAKSIGALFSYISSIVVHRSSYLKTSRNQVFFGTNYQHAYIIIRMLKQEGALKYLHRPFIMCRGGNDSFLTKNDNGIVRRFMIDFNGYHMLQNEIFKDDHAIAVAFSTAIRREHGLFNLIRLAIRVTSNTEWSAILNTLGDLNYRFSALLLASLCRSAELRFGMFSALRSIRRSLSIHSGIK